MHQKPWLNTRRNCIFITIHGIQEKLCLINMIVYVSGRFFVVMVSCIQDYIDVSDSKYNLSCTFLWIDMFEHICHTRIFMWSETVAWIQNIQLETITRIRSSKNEEISTNGIVDVFKCALLVAFPYGKIFTVVLILVKVVAFILYITHCSVSEYPYAYHSCILGIFMLWTAW